MIFMTVGLLPWTGRAETVMILSQCLDYAFKNSPTIKEADYAVAAVNESRKAVRADFLPSLSSAYTLNRLENENAKGRADNDYLNQYTRNFSVTLSQVLYAGNRTFNNYSKAKLDLERQKADRKLAELELSYNVQTAFFQLMGAKLNVRVTIESVNRLGAGAASARAYLEKSLIPYAEVLSAEVDLADAQQQLSRAKNNVNRKRIALFSLMNHPVSDTVVFEGGLAFFKNDYPSEFGVCWEKAKFNRPDLESLAKQVGMAEKQAASVMGTYLPMVKLNLGYNDLNRDYDSLSTSYYDRDQRNRYWTAGVTASWELFDGGRSWYNRKKNLQEALRIKERIKQARLSIQEGIRKALFSIAEARQRIDAGKKAMEAAKEGYKVEEHRLKAVLTTFPNLLDAQVRLTRAQGNYTQALLDYQLGRSELEFMLGEDKKADKL